MDRGMMRHRAVTDAGGGQGAAAATAPCLRRRDAGRHSRRGYEPDRDAIIVLIAPCTLPPIQKPTARLTSDSIS